MQVLDAKVDQKVFVEQLARARESVLVLDYDGTLGPFRVERDRAFPHPAVMAGRPVHDIPSLLGGLWEDLRTRPRAIT